MIPFIEYFILKIFKLMKICLAASGLFGLQMKKNQTGRMSLFSIVIGIGAGLDVFFFKQNTGIVFIFINLLFMLVFFDETPQIILKIYILCYLAVEATDAIIYEIISLVSGYSIDDITRFDNKLMDIICTFPSVLLWLVVALIFTRKNKLHLKVNLRGYFILLFGQVIATFQIAFVTYFVGGGERGNIDVTNWIVIVLMLGSSAGIVLSFLYVYKLSEIEDLQLKELYMLREKDLLTREYYQELFKRDEETRAYQHDIKHLMKLVRQYMQEGKTEETLKIIDNICASSECLGEKMIYSQNRIIDMSIHGVLGAAIAKHEIEFKYKGLMPQNIGIEDIDLCALLSNALENAYEASIICRENPRISMTSCMRGNVVLFEIENTMLKGQNNLSLKTNKKNGVHGYGIENIKRIVNSYNGEYIYKIEENTFYTSIMLEGKVGLAEKKSV